MQIAIVLGSARATVKHVSFEGQKLAVLQPVTHAGKNDGAPIIAVDAMGCRKGDRVMITSDGTYAREITKHENTPARWSVMGILD
jgi:ethanolamine utilization protein EutN